MLVETLAVELNHIVLLLHQPVEGLAVKWIRNDVGRIIHLVSHVAAVLGFLEWRKSRY